MRKQERVDDKAFRDLGFKTTMSVSDAKTHCSQLNKDRSLTRSKIRVAAKRVTEIQTLNEILFPQNRIDEFQMLLETENFGSTAHLHKQFSHFQFIQKMCNALRIQPQEYSQNAKRIYKYFISKKISASYSERLVKVLNRWGFFSSKQSDTFYQPVEVPKGREKSAIADAQLTKKGTETALGVRTESLPLTLELLGKSKLKLSADQYNWLFLSVWLGLRPSEVDGLVNEKCFAVEFDLKQGIKVLRVYQPKLKSIASSKRWKRIPIIFPEQEMCLEIIKDQKFKKPLNKTVRKYVAKGVTLYGGRKAFVDLMLARGQALESVSLWLGHRDLATTWKYYKDHSDVSFTATNETIKKTLAK